MSDDLQDAGLTDRIARFIVSDGKLPAAVVRLLPSTTEESTGSRHRSRDRLIRACAVPLLHLATDYGLPAEAAREAAAVGTEVAVRLRTAVRKQFGARGWDEYAGPVMCGVAAGTARLLALPPEAVRHCIGIAATQAAGLAAAGDAWHEFQLATAARSGIEAAQLAAAGVTAPEDGLGGRRGLFAVMAPGADRDELVNRLGRHWALADETETT